MFFAFEDRKHIAGLIVETYERLAVAATIIRGKIVTAANLWKEIDAFMTDPTSKKIEKLNERLACLYHITYHILYKSHSGEV